MPTQLDKAFVKSLNPPLSDVLPHGTPVEIAKGIGKSNLTVRNAINGASTNEEAVREALKAAIRKGEDITTLLKQVPKSVLEELKEEIRSEDLEPAN